MTLRTIVLIIPLALSIAGPARAQTTMEKPECTKANIDSTGEKITKMKDGDPKKATAAKTTSKRATAKKATA